MGKELISIIAPCYNVADTLERYLESILNQTYKHIEGSGRWVNGRHCKNSGTILRCFCREQDDLKVSIRG